MNGSYSFYKAGNVKLHATDSLAFPLRETHSRAHQDSVLTERKQFQSWETIELVLTCFSFDSEPMEILTTPQQVNIISNKQNKNPPDSC